MKIGLIMNWLIENINWVTFVGALIVLLGELLERREQTGKRLKQAKYLPFVIFVGAVIALLGSFFAGIIQERENRKIYNAVSGGDSFCYMMFTAGSKEPNSLLVLVLNEGRFPVYDVSLDVVDLSKSVNPNSFEELMENRTGFSVGNLPPSMSRVLGRWKFSNTGLQNYRVFISQRNGYFIQDIQLRFLSGKWKMATRVKKGLLPNAKVVFERVDPGYPRNSKGEVEWSL